MLLFVYGSLKKGFWNDFFLKNSKSIGHYQTCLNYGLLINNELPFMVSFLSLYPISGEVYEINDNELKAIDNLEGNGKWYTRRVISVTNNINILEVQAYFNENAQGEIQDTGIFQA